MTAYIGILCGRYAKGEILPKKSYAGAEDDEVVEDRSNQAVGRDFVQKY